MAQNARTKKRSQGLGQLCAKRRSRTRSGKTRRAIIGGTTIAPLLVPRLVAGGMRHRVGDNIDMEGVTQRAEK